MSNTVFKVRRLDISCPFDNSKKGQEYTKVIDNLVGDVVNSLVNNRHLYFKFEQLNSKNKDVRGFSIYNDSGDFVIGNHYGVDYRLFKEYIVDGYKDRYPEIIEIFKYKPCVSKPYPGFKYGFLDKNDPNYAKDLAFYKQLDKVLSYNCELDRSVIRYVFQRIMYRVVDQYDNYEIVSSLKE